MPGMVKFKDQLEEFKNIRIEHTELVKVKERINETIFFGPYNTPAPCTVVSGPSGVGKTTLFDWLEHTYGSLSAERITLTLPRRLPITVVPRAYIWITLEENPTLDKLCTDILCLYGDPEYETGDIASKTRRIDIFAHHSGTIAWFVDECQRLADRDGVVASERILDWLRARADARARRKFGFQDAKYIALFLFGLGRIEHLLTKDTQVERRYDAGLRLEAFTRKGESWEHFQEVLITFHDASPLPFSNDIRLDAVGISRKGDLAEINLNFVRFHYATWGLIGRLAPLLHRALLIAHRGEGEKSISKQVLADAFAELVITRAHPIYLTTGNVTQEREMPNPFSDTFSADLPVPAMPSDRDMLPDTKTRRKAKAELKRAARDAFRVRS